MKKLFLDIMGDLYGSDTLQGDLGANNEIFQHKVNEINEKYKLNGKTGEFIHSFKGSNDPCAPVPFVSNGSDLKFVVFGLNPKYNEEKDVTLIEKQHAGATWEEYSDFCTGGAIFDYLIRNAPSFYHDNVFMMLNSLRLQKFTSNGDFYRGKNKPDTYVETISSYKLCVADLIPYFSHTTGSMDVPMLYGNFPYLKDYFEKLTDGVFAHLEDDGWILVNGQAVSNAFLSLVGDEMVILLDNKTKGYSLGKYKGKKVIVLHEFLRRQAGKLNKNEDIEAMINTVLSCKFD